MATMKQRLLALLSLPILCASLTVGGYGSPAPTSSITVTISPAAGAHIDAGQAVNFTATVANDSTNAGVTWSCSSAGLTGTACGTFSGSTRSSTTYHAPSSVSATLTITVTATSAASAASTKSASVVVAPALKITPSTLTNATPNTNYSSTLHATGGTGTYTWTLVSGALPTGLALSPAGVIAGDPTASGTFSFTVQVADSSTASGGPAKVQARLSLTVVTVMSIVTTSVPSGSQGASYLAQIDATGGTAPYAWKLTIGPLPSGLVMGPASGVISGTPTVPGTFTFTVSAKDSSPSPQTQTRSLSITIGAAAPLAITTSSLLDGVVGKPYKGKVAVTGGAPPYTWSVVAGALPRGVTLTATTGAMSGSTLALGTSSFTIQVKDSSPAPELQTQALSIAVVNAPLACQSSGYNAMLNGPYAFSLSGFDDEGFVAVAGSFTADGTGKITAGEADADGVLGAQEGNIIASQSSYSVGPDGRGCATLSTSFGIFYTHFALGAVSSGIATAGRMAEWDSPSASAYVAAGQFLRQTSGDFAGGLLGNYAFRTVGWDHTELGGREACVGVVQTSANTLNGLAQDCNDAGSTIHFADPLTAGAYTSFDAKGRSTAIMALGEANTRIVLYMVSRSQLLAVTADPNPALSGEWDLQTLPVGASQFTQAALRGNMVFYLNGLSLAGTAAAVSMETAAADGSSSLSFKFYEDRAGVMQMSTSVTCTYAVEPDGRVTFGSGTQACGGTPPVLYLTGLNSGFIVDASPGVDTGAFEPQSAGPYSNHSLSGSFFGGMQETVCQSVNAEVDPVAPNGAGTFAGQTDTSSTLAQVAGRPFLAATYGVRSNGTFVLSSSGGAVVGIIISPNKFVMFSPSTLATPLPTLLIMQK